MLMVIPYVVCQYRQMVQLTQPTVAIPEVEIFRRLHDTGVRHQIPTLPCRPEWGGQVTPSSLGAGENFQASRLSGASR